jgi:mono/diheme cytochrome c family protein
MHAAMNLLRLPASRLTGCMLATCLLGVTPLGCGPTTLSDGDDDSSSAVAPAPAGDRSQPTPTKGNIGPTQRDDGEPEAEILATRIRPFLTRHCVECHGPDKQEGSLRLDSLAGDFTDGRAAAAWTEVMDRLNLGEMPPPEEPRPSGEEQREVVRWIVSRLSATAQTHRGPRATMRRLTRTEYSHTVRELLRVQFLPGDDPTELLPPDGTADGFDKLGAALAIDPSLMEAYLDVAARIAEKAVLSGDVSRPPVPTERHRFEYEHTPIHPYEITTRPWTVVRPDGLELMSGAAGSKNGLRHSHNKKMVPVKGRYVVRVQAGASPGRRGKPVVMSIWRGGVGQTLLQCEVQAPIDKPQAYEVTLPLEPEGSDDLNVLIVNGASFTVANEMAHQMENQVQRALEAGEARTAGRLRAQMRAEGTVWMNRPNPATLETKDLPRLFLDYIEIEGPLYDRWPPESHETVLFAGPEAAKTIDYARQIFARLLPRAYRRPVTAEEVETIVRVAAAEMTAGEPFEASVRAGLVAMLCSPSFLYLFDAAAADANANGSMLDDFQLAARLSYFLWSSLPDEELTRLASEGRLRDPAARQSQAARMLADAKAEALVTDFAAQWLRVSEFDRFAPDRELYPLFYQPEMLGLDEDLKAEPLAFFREVLSNDLSVLSFLDANWTMANRRTARLYGLPALEGDRLRRVPLPPELHRGGLLGMAGLHRAGSDGNRTKPVYRGKYVLEVLFNDPPDPPPPNAGDVEPNVEGKNLSVRQRLQQHRQVATCAACHQNIDPYGLALENFGAIGQWREHQDGEVRNWWARGGPPPIDPNGTLPNGRRFTTFAEFKQALLEQQDRFRAALAEKLTIYALGRRLDPSDRPMIEQLVARMKPGGDTLRSLIEGIVAHKAFRQR